MRAWILVAPLFAVPALSLMGAAGSAHGQSAYPAKSIRLIVPATTGGPSDIVARLLGEKLAAALGKPVVVDNRPGASNTLGMTLVAKADADGYTLLQAPANIASSL